MSEPKILFLDLESCGVNALRADLGFVVVFGFKWAHEKHAHSITISKSDLAKFDDRNVLIKASKLMAEADMLVGHFASVFDRRFIQGRLLIHNLPPIPNTKLRDTCMIARSVANYSSNRLKHLAKILNLRHRKLDNNWPDAWFQVMRGDTKALKGMAHYCEGDVLALEELYFRLRPFDNAHPRIHENRELCPVCGGRTECRGFTMLGDLKYQRFHCLKCGKWSRASRCYKPSVKPEKEGQRGRTTDRKTKKV